MEAHSRSNVSYHSSRSEVLPRMSHSSHFWPGMDNGSLHSTSDDGHSGELKLQRAGCTWSSDASPFYGPFDISACRACRPRSRAKLLFLHILCKSLARPVCCCCCWLVAWDAQSKGPAAPHAIARFPIFHAHPFIACYSSNFGPLHNVEEEEDGEGTRTFDEGMPTF